MKNKRLYDIPLGSRAVVEKIESCGSIRRRLLDIGLTRGTEVECTLINPGGNLIAYMIRGALIAIRDDDAKKILVEEI